MRDGLKNLYKSEQRIVSGVESLDIMRFIMGIFTSFSTEMEFLPRLIYLKYS